MRIGWLRSVCNIFHSFAVNCFSDEIAHARGLDPKDNLLQLLGPDRTIDVAALGLEATENYPFETGRLRPVIELVTERAGWGRQLPPGHGLGIAVHRSFVSYIATIVEVAVDDKGKLTVPRVGTAIDCGTYVNPERIASQIEGAAIMGLSLAKYGEFSFKDGKVQQSNFDDFPVIRIDESPAITNVYIVPPGADTPPSGVAFHPRGRGDEPQRIPP